MESRMNQPIFNNGSLSLKDYKEQIFKLYQETWENHILKDRIRWHLMGHFDKITETIKEPDYVLQSPSEQMVVAYVKRYEDFYILDTVRAKAYLYVLVDLYTNIIKTIYDNPKLKQWKILYER
jgi:hypothetical protein